ncbi:MAG: thrombospondin type 3 repeat-containing protein, partial [Myxococcota bacterium]
MSRLFALYLFTLVATPASAQTFNTHPLELGVFGGGYFIPDGNNELFDEDSLNFVPFEESHLELGLRIAYLPIRQFGVEAELPLVFLDTVNGDSAQLFIPRAHLIAQLGTDFTPFVLGGVGLPTVSSDDDVLGNDTDFSAHWGVGLKWRIVPEASVRVDLRQNIVADLGDARDTQFEVLGGFAYSPRLFSDPVTDSDGDGVDDREDACPTVAGKEPNGCPGDSDGDGLNDLEDKCPATSGEAEFGGCPNPDPDGDGVKAPGDECPDVAGEAEFKGCPNPDRDGDGVPNAEDDCPDLAGATENGCTEADRDGDGVKDDEDACPDAPGELAKVVRDGHRILVLVEVRTSIFQFTR